MDNNFNSDIFQICRTCMKEITDTSFFYLDYAPAANTQLTIRQKLYYCMPELDLNIVLNPVICSRCVDILLSVYEFKKNCFQSEIQINKYVQQVQFTGDVNLVEVLRFHQLRIKNFDMAIKMEDIKNEDLVCDASVFNEASECTESMEPKYYLKLEKVDPEYVLFNTFDDFKINYNLTAAEENLDAHNSNIAQNCLSEVTEHQDNYSKNLNKTHSYFQCYKCGHEAESKLKLILHLKCHTRKNFHHREIISKILSRYKNVFYYGCSLCNYLTKYKCLFDFHNRIHLTKKHYKCIYKHTDICTKAFRTIIKVNKKNMKDNKKICVKNCHYNNLKRNMRTYTAQKSFKCSICKYCCNCKVNLKRHMQLHTGEKRFACSVCEYQCNFKVNLKQHILIHTGEKPFSCSICEYQCSRKHDLKRHILIHTGVKPFSCSICEYQCSRKHDLKRHILIHTGAKPFSCSVCEYRCRQKQDLKKHMRIHTGEKPFSCSVCEYQFSRNEHLKQHMQIHTGEKPFSCSICEYQCTQESNLKQHMRIHTGEKPFSCSICEYQSSWKSVLKQHILIHTGEKPFSCSTCEYQCSQKSQLKRHMQTHTREKPFSCSICEYQCRCKSHLNKHMRIHTE